MCIWLKILDFLPKRLSWNFLDIEIEILHIYFILSCSISYSSNIINCKIKVGKATLMYRFRMQFACAWTLLAFLLTPMCSIFRILLPKAFLKYPKTNNGKLFYRTWNMLCESSRISFTQIRNSTHTHF